MVLRAAMASTAVVLSLTTVGCGGDPPNKEIQQAQAAIETARAAGADLYGTDELAAATVALRDANAAVEQHDYRLALNHALDSRERAENATRLAADGKSAARAKAAAAVAEATNALDSLRTLMKAAEGARTTSRAVADSRAATAQAEAQVQEARSALEHGNYGQATEQATAAASLLKATEATLSTALASAPRRRR